MKKIILLICLIPLFCLMSNKVYSQSGWTQGSYYAEQGTDEVICGQCFPVLIGYNGWGQPLYRYQRTCKVMQWHEWFRTHYGYFWHCDMYSNCNWEYKTDTRYWYWFDWYIYTEWCN